MSFNPSRTKIQIKLSLTRIKLLIQKKNALAKNQRRAIAQFLENGKVETATIRTESIINDDLHVELLEVLELYLEVLAARFGLLETHRECDPGISDAVCGIIYAASRTEMKELHILREMLMAKFGRDFSIAVMDNKDGCVPTRITSKLSTETPSSTLVDAYMYEIAKAYSVDFVPDSIKKAEEEEKALGKPESVPKVVDKETREALATVVVSDHPTAPTSNTDKQQGVQPARTEGAKSGSDDLGDLMKRLEALKRK